MSSYALRILTAGLGLLTAASLHAADPFVLSAGERAAAAADYQTYCALCHGAERQGYVNDHAPSLRSESLLRSGFPWPILNAIAYGRRGTPMGAYFDEVGGPLDRDRLYRLVRWLGEMVDVDPLHLPPDAVEGDIDLGRETYAAHCTECHGANGEGVTGPAVGNPAMLALTPDTFLRYAIENGRDGTAMPAFGDTLSAAEIDGVTAFLRSRATGWSVEKPVLRAPPDPADYVLNPAGAAPVFTLEDGRYVRADALAQALEDKRRMVLLDTRVMSMWQLGHIEGAVPIPYYSGDFSAIAERLPDDGTWIVSYCECPRAAADSVNRKLRAHGFTNTAVLWEGIGGWVAQGYRVAVGQRDAATSLPLE
jgi:mono/diheme cytochrome c family protein/rhodanese-related sulfurtransferase